MAEIIETTGHIAFSPGTFIRERLEVGFLEQPVVSPLFMLVRCFTKRVLLSVFMQCSRQLFTSGHESQSRLHNLCHRQLCCPWKQKLLWKEGTLQGARQKIISSIGPVPCLKVFLLHEQQPFKNCIGLQYFIII